MENVEILNIDLIKDFVAKLNNAHIESTGATVVNITGNLYNVDGSTNDPIPNGASSWKQLLMENGINHDCYVTNLGAGGSHPVFSVGGHMTMNPNGQVADGGICYLMPLCSWHNSKSRDGVPFTHTETRMLQLTGYMQGELYVTFRLRLPSEKPFAVLFYHECEWKFKNISHEEAANLQESVFNDISPNKPIDYYVLIERKKITSTICQVATSYLP